MTQTKTFYSALENARGVHDLDVTSTWECTTEDFRTLSSTIDKSACCSTLQSLRLGFLTHCDEDLLILLRVTIKEGRSLRDLNLVSPGWKSLSSLEQAVIQLQHDLVHDGSGNGTAFRRLLLEDFVDEAQATLKFDSDGAITPTTQLKSIILQEYQHDFREVVKGEQRKLFMQLKGHHLDSLAVMDKRHLFPGIFLYILSAIEERQGQSLLMSVFIRTKRDNSVPSGFTEEYHPGVS
ncbi:hypothetical protein EMPS_00048 [Entomortierella parvispora]|uniref:Uncharacterized protein n=1 Tax=Entomortierella parvispora TaxID=205924 RepID=A0A9P3LRF3_9FUNG|nr:hypothetical protein EMPS_00048 [Entomortierella parvispora]